MVHLTVTEIDRINAKAPHKYEERADEKVILTKDEVIDILKTLEGIKRKLQPRVR